MIRSVSVDTETVTQLICDPNVYEAENKDVDRNVEFDIKKDEHDEEEDEEPCRPMTWTVVHAEGVRDRDLGVHGTCPLLQSADYPIDYCPPILVLPAL